MKQNMKRQMSGRKRKVSIPGGLITLAASIALIWIADGIWRHFLYEAPDPKVWLSVSAGSLFPEILSTRSWQVIMA